MARPGPLKRVLRVATVTALVTVGSLGPTAATGQATPSAPLNLRASDGGNWQSYNHFSLSWDNPPPAGAAIAAVHYRVRDSYGAVVVGESRLNGPEKTVGDISLPAPGAYKAEVWLEDTLGSQGPAATAVLHFDNLRPGTAQPLVPAGWLGRTAFPYTLRLGHPEGQAPASGIYGYAVSVDSTSETSPCSGGESCTTDETDLHGGVEDDELTIGGLLPEGANYVHAVAVSGARMRSTTIGQAVLLVDLTDPVTTLSEAPIGWSDGPVALTAVATDAASGMEPGAGVTPFTAIRIDGGAPVVGEGPSVTATVIGEGTHSIAFYARDAAGNVNDGNRTNGIVNRDPSKATVRIDRTAPGVAFFDSQDAADPELIRVAVNDNLSGADLSRGWIGVRRAGSGEHFDPLEVHAAAGGLEARWDSDSYPTGRYEFRAVGHDRAGNSTTTELRANGERMVLPNPVKAPTTLTAGLVRPTAAPRCRRRGARDRCRQHNRSAHRSGADELAEDLVVPFGHSATLAGHLDAAAGVPVASVPIEIVERFAAGADLPERVSTISTGSDGAFKVALPPGPSREVTARFGGTRALGRSSAHDMQLRTSSEVKLAVSAPVARVGGRPVIFSGNVAASGCPIPANGKSVQLEFRIPGQPWTEFRSVQTDRRGDFRYAYRFSDDDSRGVRFQFRAFAPTQSDWPYEPAGSGPVAVRGV